jgi:3-dehydrosphinganine reductase
VCISADVTIFEQIENAVKNSIDQLGPIDVLLACAGKSMPNLFIDTPLENFESVFSFLYLSHHD